MFKLSKNSSIIMSLKTCSNSFSTFPVLCKNLKKIEEKDFIQSNFDLVEKKEPKSMYQVKLLTDLGYKSWNEKKAIRRTKKENKFLKQVDNITDLARTIQNLKNFPLSLQEWITYLENKRDRMEYLEQKFLPERQKILKPDLAAAHFLLNRKGSFKFVGQKEWIGVRHTLKPLPNSYVPGFFIEAINAEQTYLIYEGLKNLTNLKFLKWLSLKGLKDIDDWCMDWISQEYSYSLEYLDISDCVNVTYRALSCFYRFENLKTLVVKGVPDTLDFKLACIMLLEIKPDLDIQGINLEIPEKIEPVEPEKLHST